MIKGILNLITLSHQLEWIALSEDGIDTKVIFVKVLRYDDRAMRAPTILLKFEPGARLYEWAGCMSTCERHTDIFYVKFLSDEIKTLFLKFKSRPHQILTAHLIAGVFISLDS